MGMLCLIPSLFPIDSKESLSVLMGILKAPFQGSSWIPAHEVKKRPIAMLGPQTIEFTPQSNLPPQTKTAISLWLFEPGTT